MDRSSPLKGQDVSHKRNKKQLPNKDESCPARSNVQTQTERKRYAGVSPTEPRPLRRFF